MDTDRQALFRAGAHRNGVFRMKGPRRAPPPRWSFSAPGPIETPPVCDGGTVYVGTRAGTVHALELATGREKWSARVEGAVRAPMQREGSRLILAAESPGELRFSVLDAESGEALSRVTSEGLEGRTDFFLALGDRVYFTDNQCARAVSLTTGKEAWVFSGNFDSDCCPAAADGLVLCVESGAHQGYSLYALDAQTGQKRWRYFSMPNGNPVIANGLVYIAENGGGVCGLSLEDGRLRWSWMTGYEEKDEEEEEEDEGRRIYEFCTHRSSVVSSDTLYVGGDGYVSDEEGSGSGPICVAVDLATGQERWIVRVDEGLWSMAPVLVEELVYFGTEKGSVLAVDSRTGEQRFRLAPQSNLWTPVSGGLVVAHRETLTAFVEAQTRG